MYIEAIFFPYHFLFRREISQGKTDMRKGINGHATLIQDSLKLDPYGDSIFLFSGWSKDRYKCLYFDGEIVPFLFYKTMLRGGALLY